MSVASKAANPEKGKRYISLLDQALCNGNWTEVPELARKVEKHAPERKCLTLTARSEAHIAFGSNRPASPSLSGASTATSLDETATKLRSAIDGTSAFPGDAYCARVCLAEIYWRQDNSTEALSVLPRDQSLSEKGGNISTTLGWQEVCAVKESFIRAAAYEALGQEAELEQLYHRATGQTPGSRTPELRRWTERLLARACLHHSRQTQQPTLDNLSGALVSYRAWSDFWQRAPQPHSKDSKNASADDVPRRQVWKTYYELLTTIVQRDLIYNSPTGSNFGILRPRPRDVSGDNYNDTGNRQYSDLKRVEATYESLLLSETHFPKASESNVEVEAFIEQVIGNWKVFCGSTWTDADLGDGGKESASRAVLDTLYRAATRTFHSTVILRQLFTVHASIGEFDLAIHAFDSYQDIISKGKARAEKTGKHESGFDNDDVALLTAADAVRVLCKFGDRQQCEKALEVSSIIEQWLAAALSATSSNMEVVDEGKPQKIGTVSEPQLQSASLAAAFRAIGTSHATWALLTYEPEKRSELQAEAIKNFRLAGSHDPRSIPTSYALAKVLAERREVPAAIQVLKNCIAAPALIDEDEDPEDSDSLAEQARQRELIPLWHLLALCLSSRDEYESAIKACQAAFEQFEGSNTLFGQSSYLDLPGGGKPQGGRASRGLVDQMDSTEKETIMLIKTTQLTFVELTEGPTIAVDHTNELLTLYARLFGAIEKRPSPSQSTQPALSPSPSRAGVNLRSIAGSIRPKSSRAAADKHTAKPAVNKSADPTSQTSGDALDPASTDGQAVGSPISITVTNEDGIPAEKHAHVHHHLHPHMPFKTKKHNDANHEHVSANTVSDSAAPPPPPKGTNAVDQATASHEVGAIDERPLKEMAHNIPHDQQPPPAGHPEQPPHQDLRLPARHPASLANPQPRLASLQERQHKTTILVKVWLFISALYSRAGLYDDAHGALDEVSKLVESFETEKAQESSSSRSFLLNGWGGGKSVDALWADVYSAKGDLASAQTLPFEAATNYEQSLSHFPDHAGGIIGISNILMDIYEEKMPAEEPIAPLTTLPASSGSLTNSRSTQSRPATAKSSVINVPLIEERFKNFKEPTPAELNRLAARDRAYMLLSNLTKLGTGWDDSEAWLTLARSHELSGEVGRAKQALWWVVELEDSKPVTPWREVAGGGGYAL